MVMDEGRAESDRLVDLHVLVIPPEQWRTDVRWTFSSACLEAVSVGFVRIYPEMELKQLRHEIQIQLVTKDVPKTFLFLRLVGKSLAQVSAKQEGEITAKHYIPPYTSSPEIYLLSSNRLSSDYSSKAFSDFEFDSDTTANNGSNSVQGVSSSLTGIECDEKALGQPGMPGSENNDYPIELRSNFYNADQSHRNFNGHRTYHQGEAGTHSQPRDGVDVEGSRDPDSSDETIQHDQLSPEGLAPAQLAEATAGFEAALFGKLADQPRDVPTGMSGRSRGRLEAAEKDTELTAQNALSTNNQPRQLSAYLHQTDRVATKMRRYQDTRTPLSMDRNQTPPPSLSGRMREAKGGSPRLLDSNRSRYIVTEDKRNGDNRQINDGLVSNSPQLQVHYLLEERRGSQFHATADSKNSRANKELELLRDSFHRGVESQTAQDSSERKSNEFQLQMSRDSSINSTIISQDSDPHVDAAQGEQRVESTANGGYEKEEIPATRQSSNSSAESLRVRSTTVALDKRKSASSDCLADKQERVISEKRSGTAEPSKKESLQRSDKTVSTKHNRVKFAGEKDQDSLRRRVNPPNGRHKQQTLGSGPSLWVSKAASKPEVQAAETSIKHAQNFQEKMQRKKQESRPDSGGELTTIFAERDDLTTRHGLLVAQARSLQIKLQKSRYESESLWKKRFLSEKKTTLQLEQQCAKLQQQLHLALVQNRIERLNNGKRNHAKNVQEGLFPSQQSNIKIQCAKLNSDIAELRRNVKQAETRLKNEHQAREKLEAELRGLKQELLQQKITASLVRARVQ
ncbi:uncharacterized protein [Oscarella lobularis]|uniref:uncharacterized protein isoform X2 n=1 Tax=Oscarella lobularis TaxID=121494 RepID=UPI003313DFBA